MKYGQKINGDDYETTNELESSPGRRGVSLPHGDRRGGRRNGGGGGGGGFGICRALDFGNPARTEAGAGPYLFP